MKKILFVLVACVLFTLSANAQKVRYGVKAGLNYSDSKVKVGLDYLDSEVKGISVDTDAIFTLNAGVFAQIDLTNRFLVQPELLFTQAGAKYIEKAYLNYIALPVMAKYKLSDAFCLEFGPQIGYLVSAKNDGNDVSAGFKDYALNLNIGVDYLINQNILVGVRYSHGLNNISSISGLDMKSRQFQLSVGYIF